MKIISSFLFLVFLMGCVSNSKVTSQSIQQMGDQQLKEEVSKLSLLQKDECLKPVYAPLRAKAPCSTTDISLAQLADSTKITDSQKILFIQAASTLDTYTKSITALYRRSESATGQRIAEARESAFVQVTNNRLELIDRKITWGQYLRNRQAIELEMLKRAQSF